MPEISHEWSASNRVTSAIRSACAAFNRPQMNPTSTNGSILETCAATAESVSLAATSETCVELMSSYNHRPPTAPLQPCPVQAVSVISSCGVTPVTTDDGSGRSQVDRHRFEQEQVSRQKTAPEEGVFSYV